MDINFTLNCIQLFYQTGDQFYLSIMDQPVELIETVVDSILEFELAESQVFNVAPEVSEECLDSILEYAKFD